MFFSWLRTRRRRQLLAQPFPDAWREVLNRDVALYHYLPAAEQARLCDDLRVFIAEKSWEGCGGLELTDEVRVAVAAQACLLVLGWEPFYFDRVPAILVYPNDYQVPKRAAVEGDLVLEEEDVALDGESHYRGPVVLSWDDVLWEGRHPSDGRNLVFHEFAHQLDMLDGTVNGTPLLSGPDQERRWREVMTAEYDRHVADTEAGRPTLLDDDAAADEGEFFAVATEFFFNKPGAVRRRHPRLYDLFRDYYHQDPGEWRRRVPPAGGSQP